MSQTENTIYTTNIPNPFDYIKNEEDVQNVVKTIMQKNTNNFSSKDPFWEKTEQALLSAIFLYVFYEYNEKDKNLLNVKKLLHSRTVSNLENMFDNLEEDNPKHPAVKLYKIFALSGYKTRQTILAQCKNNSFLQI